MASSVIKNQTMIKSVRYTIPAGTGTNNFAYPTGFNFNNCIFIGAKIRTQYNSWVDITFNAGSMNYWGNIVFKLNSFDYIPNHGGDATEIIFAFAQI